MVDVTENLELPESIDYNETDVADQRKRANTPYPKYREGLFEFQIVEVRKEVAKNSKDLQLAFAFKAVDSNGELVNNMQWHRVGIPLPNPKVPGHKPGGVRRAGESQEDFDARVIKMMDLYRSKAREIIRAFWGDDTLPAFPRKREQKKDNKSVYYLPDNPTVDISPVEHKARADQINKLTLEYLKDIYNTGGAELLINKARLYAYVRPSNDGKYVNVSYLRHDQGSGEVIRSNFFV